MIINYNILEECCVAFKFCCLTCYKFIYNMRTGCPNETLNRLTLKMNIFNKILTLLNNHEDVAIYSQIFIFPTDEPKLV